MRPSCPVCRGRILRCPRCGGPVIHTIEVEDFVHRQPTFHSCLHCAHSLEEVEPARPRRLQTGRQGWR